MENNNKAEEQSKIKEVKKDDVEEVKKDDVEEVKKDDVEEVKKDDVVEVSIEEKLKETEDKLLRTLAEVENQRRRFEKEINDAFKFGGFNLAKETLGLLDNLQRAQISIKNDEKLKKSDDFESFIKNLEIIEKDLVVIFERNNIKKIKCINEKFDPNLHQAMLEIEDSEAEAGIVLQEIQPGYMMDERLLRPSFVGVSKKKEDKEKEE